MAIECIVCGRKPSDPSGRVAVVRLNRKGVPGIWLCAPGTGTGCQVLETNVSQASPIEGPAARRRRSKNPLFMRVSSS